MYISIPINVYSEGHYTVLHVLLTESLWELMKNGYFRSSLEDILEITQSNLGILQMNKQRLRKGYYPDDNKALSDS